LSSHLAILSNADLLTSHRESRSIIYRINFDGTRELLSFLMEDCCQGQPELCSPVLDSLLSSCCASDNPLSHNTPSEHTSGETHEKNAR
jgi:ArsR family transcriptional regulator